MLYKSLNFDFFQNNDFLVCDFPQPDYYYGILSFEKENSCFADFDQLFDYIISLLQNFEADDENYKNEFAKLLNLFFNSLPTTEKFEQILSCLKSIEAIEIFSFGLLNSVTHNNSIIFKYNILFLIVDIIKKFPSHVFINLIHIFTKSLHDFNWNLFSNVLSLMKIDINPLAFGAFLYRFAQLSNNIQLDHLFKFISPLKYLISQREYKYSFKICSLFSENHPNAKFIYAFKDLVLTINNTLEELLNNCLIDEKDLYHILVLLCNCVHHICIIPSLCERLNVNLISNLVSTYNNKDIQILAIEILVHFMYFQMSKSNDYLNKIKIRDIFQTLSNISNDSSFKTKKRILGIYNIIEKFIDSTNADFFIDDNFFDIILNFISVDDSYTILETLTLCYYLSRKSDNIKNEFLKYIEFFVELIDEMENEIFLDILISFLNLLGYDFVPINS